MPSTLGDSLLSSDQLAGTSSGAGGPLLRSLEAAARSADALKAANAKARRQLLAAMFFCVVFMIAEVVGGFLANSLAIMTDAAHLLSDVASFAISLFAVWLAERKPTENATFGFHRIEVFGAIASVFLIWVLTGVLCYEAVLRIITPEEVDGRTMFIVAALGVVVNLVMMRILSQSSGGGGDHHGHSHDPIALFKAMMKGDSDHGHSHAPAAAPAAPAPAHGHSHSGGGSHGHSHGAAAPAAPAHGHAHAHGAPAAGGASCSHEEGGGHGHAHGGGGGGAAAAASRRLSLEEAAPDAGAALAGHGENINVRAAFIHALGDLVQSVGVVMAAAIIWAQPDAHIADPICTFLFSILVLFTTWGILKSAFHALLNSVPPGINLARLAARLAALPGVSNVHDLHVWGYGTGLIAMTVHLVADDPARALVGAQRIGKAFGIAHTTVQVERCGSTEVVNCYTFNEHIGACKLLLGDAEAAAGKIGGGGGGHGHAHGGAPPHAAISFSGEAAPPLPPPASPGGRMLDRPHPLSRHDAEDGCKARIVAEEGGAAAAAAPPPPPSPPPPGIAGKAANHGHSHGGGGGHGHSHGAAAPAAAAAASSPPAHSHAHSHGGGHAHAPHA